jgi:hypothetical protein
MPTTQEQLDALDARIDELEQQIAKTVSINQTAEMIKTAQSLNEGYDTRLTELERKAVIYAANIASLFGWRTDIRHEMRAEVPTLVSGTTYVLSKPYDETALFLIFNAITKTPTSQITFSDPAAGKFDVSVPLQATAVAIYFERIPDPTT